MCTDKLPPMPYQHGVRRLVQLDILRGVAILLVLGNHAPFWNQAGHFQAFASVWHRAGWAGVDLFFVLSGFLIGGLLFKELLTHASLDLKRFYMRRGLKIWPSYYLCVGLAVLLMLARTHGDVACSLTTMLPNFLHVQNYDAAQRPIEHTWSLAVEEHFYLALPLCLWILTRRGKDLQQSLRRFPGIAGAILVFCLLYRCLVNTGFPFSAYSHIFYTHIRADSLVWGVLLAYWYHFEPHKLAFMMQRRWLLIGIGSVLILPILLFDRETTPFIWTFGYSLLYLGFGNFLIAALESPTRIQVDCNASQPMVPRIMRHIGSGIAHIGFYSYAIYLWHNFFAGRPLETLFRNRMMYDPSLKWLCVTLLYVALAVTVGALMGTIVDRPFLAWRDCRYPARARIFSSVSVPHKMEHKNGNASGEPPLVEKVASTCHV